MCTEPTQQLKLPSNTGLFRSPLGSLFPFVLVLPQELPQISSNWMFASKEEPACQIFGSQLHRFRKDLIRDFQLFLALPVLSSKNIAIAVKKRTYIPNFIPFVLILHLPLRIFLNIVQLDVCIEGGTFMQNFKFIGAEGEFFPSLSPFPPYKFQKSHLKVCLRGIRNLHTKFQVSSSRCFSLYFPLIS